MKTFVRHAIAAVAAALSLHAAPSLAQTWPQRTVKFVIPLGPGSGVDISARLISERLTALWGQAVALLRGLTGI